VDRKEGGGCLQAPVYSAISFKVTPFLEAPVIGISGMFAWLLSIPYLSGFHQSSSRLSPHFEILIRKLGRFVQRKKSKAPLKRAIPLKMVAVKLQDSGNDCRPDSTSISP
jgi:hypothetical protein